jgi:hypothetical protein
LTPKTNRTSKGRMWTATNFSERSAIANSTDMVGKLLIMGFRGPIIIIIIEANLYLPAYVVAALNEKK